MSRLIISSLKYRRNKFTAKKTRVSPSEREKQRVDFEALMELKNMEGFKGHLQKEIVSETRVLLSEKRERER